MNKKHPTIEVTQGFLHTLYDLLVYPDESIQKPARRLWVALGKPPEFASGRPGRKPQ